MAGEEAKEVCGKSARFASWHSAPGSHSPRHFESSDNTSSRSRSSTDDSTSSAGSGSGGSGSGFSAERQGQVDEIYGDCSAKIRGGNPPRRGL